MTQRRRGLATAVIGCLLLATACTDTAPTTTAPATTAAPPIAQPTTAPPVTTTAPPPPPVDRLVVVDGAGDVVTMDPSGGNVTALTTDADADTVYFQPSWSPDANSIVVSRTDGTDFSLVAFDLDGATTSEVATDGNAFYVYWSPTSDRIAYLRSDARGMGLAIAEFGDEPTATLVERGQPFYFSWSPDGARLATLVGQQDFTVREGTPGSDPTPIAAPGAFLNPVWTEAGIFYVTRANGSDELVLGEPDGAATVLARSPAGAIFTAPPSGERVAIQASGEIGGVQAARQQVPQLPLNRLVVIDATTGELTPVTDSQAIAFFWDPAGRQLLVLDAADRALRWSVWADGELTELVQFLPARNFLQSYLPFFGQYALSTTMWAPDGGAFAFAGLIDGEGGIWVQQVAGGDPMKVSDGRWVMWSPR